jgi:hypothetical protein
MAGEWLKVELSTPDKPEILRMARILGIDKDAVFGKLIRVWGWFDRNSVDGRVDGVVADDIDSIALQIGFAEAMKSVHWINFDNDALWVTLSNFDRHNGQTAKQRALKNVRQSKWRANVDDDASTEASTEESSKRLPEKRREEKNIKTSIPKNFAISENVRAWAFSKNINNLDAHLENFVNACIAKNYTYVDWDRAFMNAISKNWANVQNKKPNGVVL